MASFAELAETVTPKSKIQHQLMARIDANIVSCQPRPQPNGAALRQLGPC
ncbi:MAG: hypothetical protein WCL57_18955 [Chloroflexota bacterium]|nr:hypothetical protein [Chloroflexota bacterium]